MLTERYTQSVNYRCHDSISQYFYKCSNTYSSYMNNDFIEKLKASNLWDKDYKDLDDFIDNGLLKADFIPNLPKIIANVVRTGDMMKVIADKHLSAFDLSIPQKHVLEALYFSKKEYLTQQELSKFVYTSKANMSSLLDRMESKGFIERKENKTNKREKKVILLKKGEELYVKLLAFAQKHEEFAFNQIVSEDEAKVVHDVLQLSLIHI